MQIKTTLRFHLTPSECPSSKKKKKKPPPNADEDGEPGNGEVKGGNS
jgi:hypothetical protein